MQTNQQILINKIIESDDTLSKNLTKKILAILDGKEATKAPLLTTRQAADYLQMHPVSLRMLGQKGVLKPIRYSARKLRWPEDMLTEYLYNGPEVTNEK
jgi:hypothetical protein